MKNRRNRVENDQLSKLLKDRNVSIFRDVFRENSKKIVEEFGKHSLIVRLRNLFKENLKREHAFRTTPNNKLVSTYKKIEKNLSKMGFILPEWWGQMCRQLERQLERQT
jgi:hypothetical protein